MVVTNLSLYREYKKVINLVSDEVRCDFERLDVKTKIIKSQFMDAWKDVKRIICNLCKYFTSHDDKKRLNDFCSEVYIHTIVLAVVK